MLRTSLVVAKGNTVVNNKTEAQIKEEKRFNIKNLNPVKLLMPLGIIVLLYISYLKYQNGKTRQAFFWSLPVLIYVLLFAVFMSVTGQKLKDINFGYAKN